MILKVARIHSDVHREIQRADDIARHLINSEFGAPLSTDDIVVEELVLKAGYRSRKVYASASSDVPIMDWFSRIPQLVAEEAGIVKMLLTSNSFDILLLDQPVALRAGFLKLLKLLRSQIVCISYEPFPGTPDLESKVSRWNWRAFLYRRCECLAFVSEVQARYLSQLLGGNTVCRSFPMGIDTEKFVRTGPPVPGTIYMADGALRDYELLRDAISLLANVPKRLTVSHRSQLSSEKLNILNSIRSLGCTVVVKGLANIAELRDLYSSAEIVVLPVKPSSQPAGLTGLLESLAMGCAVITTDSYWIEQYVNPGQEVLVATDASEFAREIQRILDKHQMADELRENAKQASLKYSLARGKQEMRQILREVAG